MREITTHKVNGCNDQITVHAVDGPGAGGASHVYRVDGPTFTDEVRFQNGPIAAVGVNGTTHEVLLAIVRDRLAMFQAGPYSCEENGAALAAVESAIGHLHRRTLARLARGVEGTHAK